MPKYKACSACGLGHALTTKCRLRCIKCEGIIRSLEHLTYSLGWGQHIVCPNPRPEGQGRTQPRDQKGSYRAIDK
jgi:hypothetical protein